MLTISDMCYSNDEGVCVTISVYFCFCGNEKDIVVLKKKLIKVVVILKKPPFLRWLFVCSRVKRLFLNYSKGFI